MLELLGERIISRASETRVNRNRLLAQHGAVGWWLVGPGFFKIIDTFLKETHCSETTNSPYNEQRLGGGKRQGGSGERQNYYREWVPDLDSTASKLGPISISAPFSVHILPVHRHRNLQILSYVMFDMPLRHLKSGLILQYQILHPSGTDLLPGSHARNDHLPITPFWVLTHYLRDPRCHLVAPRHCLTLTLPLLFIATDPHSKTNLAKVALLLRI